MDWNHCTGTFPKNNRKEILNGSFRPHTNFCFQFFEIILEKATSRSGINPTPHPYKGVLLKENDVRTHKKTPGARYKCVQQQTLKLTGF